MTAYIQVLTTIDSRTQAARIAQHLVESRLAACVQILGPLTSTYRWQGQVAESEEWLCIAKTEDLLYPQVEAAIRAVHSYQTPEILAVPIVNGGQDYLDWITGTLRGE